jgi:multisubunit Na+/H+ antiporter MnhB subunit
MRVDKITFAGALLAILVMVILVIIISRDTFPIFGYVLTPGHYINVTQNVGPESSNFMWTYRNMDLIVQAFVLFAAAAGCLAMLRTNEEEKPA